MHTRIVLAFTCVVVGLSACADTTVSVPTSVSTRVLPEGEATAADRWMRTTRTIIGRREFGSPLFVARNFALVAVAGYNASVIAGTPLSPPARRGARPSEAGAVAGASAAVLRALYPMEDSAITRQLAEDRVYFAQLRSQRGVSFAAGEAIGAQAAVAVLARAANDGTHAQWTGTIPVGPGFWLNAPPPAQPIAPLWGEAKGWFIRWGKQFRPAAPPAFGSVEHTAALAEVKALVAARTPAQLASAQFWQFGSGPAGPVGHYAEVASDLTIAAGYDERRTARVHAVLQMAIMDATIACWDAKYTWWTVRPYHVDPSITTPVGRPNFPAYPSAHSCISGAAGNVLSSLFPASKPLMDAKIAEAGMSRIYAGLHYRFDITAGNEIGARVAALAIQLAPKGRALVPLQ